MKPVSFFRMEESVWLPTYATDGAACFDIYAHLPAQAAFSNIEPTANVLIPTGLKVAVPEDHVMLIFSRSGHGFKNNTRLANCVGVIDSDYRGELMVKLTRDDGGEIWVSDKERIAQAMIIPVHRWEIGEVQVESDLGSTERGEGGFGSTGR